MIVASMRITISFVSCLTFCSVMTKGLNTPRLGKASMRSNIASFKVMDVVERATQLEKEGKNLCHMEVS